MKKMMGLWQSRAEHWETQMLGYFILSYLIEDKHPSVAWFLFGYAIFTAVGVLVALNKKDKVKPNA